MASTAEICSPAPNIASDVAPRTEREAEIHDDRDKDVGYRGRVEIEQRRKRKPGDT